MSHIPVSSIEKYRNPYATLIVLGGGLDDHLLEHGDAAKPRTFSAAAEFGAWRIGHRFRLRDGFAKHRVGHQPTHRRAVGRSLRRAAGADGKCPHLCGWPHRDGRDQLGRGSRWRRRRADGSRNCRNRIWRAHRLRIPGGASGAPQPDGGPRRGLGIARDLHPGAARAICDRGAWMAHRIVRFCRLRDPRWASSRLRSGATR